MPLDWRPNSQTVPAVLANDTIRQRLALSTSVGKPSHPMPYSLLFFLFLLLCYFLCFFTTTLHHLDTNSPRSPRAPCFEFGGLEGTSDQHAERISGF